MEQVTTLSENVSQTRSGPVDSRNLESGGRRKRSLKRVMWVCVPLVFLGVMGGLSVSKWPFRYQNIQPLLERVFAGHVAIDHYRLTFFPHPGLIADGLTLRRNTAPDLPAVGSAQRLVIQGRWLDILLLRRRVHLVDVEGFHVVIPAIGTRANREDFPPGSSMDFGGPTTPVEEFRMLDATLDLMRADGSRYSFPVHRLVIRNLVKGQAISYDLDMGSARPSGHIEAKGSFGPLRPEQLGATPVTGEFTYTGVALSDIHGLKGTLSSHGDFHGVLMAIQAQAKTATPDFAVGHGRATHVRADARCAVDALNGDIHFDAIDAYTGETTVHAHGDIAGNPKVTNLDIDVEQGRAQDLLTPFMRRESPVAGAVRLHSHAYLASASSNRKFLQRLHMTGRFAIPAERLTNGSLEHKLSQFSERAQGQTSGENQSVQDVLSSLVGEVTVDDGIASAHDLRFAVPGAWVKLTGFFSFRNGDAKFRGDLHMTSDISHLTTGFKSWMLKPIAPLFKRRNAGAVFPVAVIGSDHKYRVTSDLLHSK